MNLGQLDLSLSSHFINLRVQDFSLLREIPIDLAHSFGDITLVAVLYNFIIFSLISLLGNRIQLVFSSKISRDLLSNFIRMFFSLNSSSNLIILWHKFFLSSSKISRV